MYSVSEPMFKDNRVTRSVPPTRAHEMMYANAGDDDANMFVEICCAFLCGTAFNLPLGLTKRTLSLRSYVSYVYVSYICA